MITERSFVTSAFALLWEGLFPIVMNWRLASWIEAFRLHDLKTAFSWIELPCFSCRRQFMRCGRKSWRKPIHAHKGNSWWARIDNVGKSFVIARAHFLCVFFFWAGKEVEISWNLHFATSFLKKALDKKRDLYYNKINIGFWTECFPESEATGKA